MNLFDLTGKVAAVTGSSRGIGRAIAIALAEAGAEIVCVQRSTADDNAANEIRRLGKRAEIVPCDLAEKTRVKQVMRDITAVMGRLDILVNNAGIQRSIPAEDFSDADWEEVIQINLTSMFTLCREAGKYMIAHSGGKIINIASLMTFIAHGNIPAYCAAKSGVAGMTRSLAVQWARHGVSVNAIAPGYILTDMTRGLESNAGFVDAIPMGRMGTPPDLAGAAVFLASPASDYVCGHTLVVDGGVLCV